MKQLWYCKKVSKNVNVIRCEATLDSGRQAGVERAVPWPLMRESASFIRNWMGLQIIAMAYEIDRLNSSTITSRVNEAFRMHHRITDNLPNAVYVGHAEWRAIPLNGGAYYKDRYGREFFMNLRVIRVDLPEWLQVTRIDVWGDV